MESAAKKFFDSINSLRDLNLLIEEGQAESLFLECKSPSEPKLNQSLKNELAQAISGFSNTGGGVIIWGASTTNKGHSGLDLITQIEPIGACNKFSTEIGNKIPLLTIPPVFISENKIIKAKVSDTKGVVLTYIPPTNSDPVQSTTDDHFYYRAGDSFIKTPYQMLKRLFAATESPDVDSFFSSSILKKDGNSYWNIPISLTNKSSAVAHDVHVTVEVDNANCCEDIKVKSFKDVSSVNPGKKVFMLTYNDVLHKGLPSIVGFISIKMKPRKIKINLSIDLFSDKMRARRNLYSLYLNKDKFRIKKESESFIY